MKYTAAPDGTRSVGTANGERGWECGGALGFGLLLPLRKGLTDHGFASSKQTDARHTALSPRPFEQVAGAHAFLSAVHV